MSRTAAAVLLAMVFPSLMAWLYFVAAAGNAAPDPPLSRNPLAVALFTGGKVVQFAFTILWGWLAEHRRLEIHRPGPVGIDWGFSTGLLVAGGILGTYYGLLRGGQVLPLEGVAARVHAKMAEFGLLVPAAFLGFALFLSGVHSLLEEYYWRWFVFGRLAGLTPLGWAIALSSLAFGAHHLIDLAVFFPGRFWTAAVPLTLGVVIGGGFWAWLYNRTGSLYATWLSHALVDAALMAVGYDLIFVYGKTR